MRLKHRQRQLDAARRAIEAKTAQAIQAELTRLWRRLRSDIRALDQQRPTTLGKRRLRKATFTGGAELWQDFNARLQDRLTQELGAGGLTLNQIHNAHFATTVGAGWQPIELNTADFVSEHTPRTGELIVDRLHEPNSDLTARCIHITQEIRDTVGAAVADWYNTPETTLQDLVDQLHPLFSTVRAQRIAITETTFLNSRVTKSRMRELGIREWTWDTRRDEIVCRVCGERHGRKYSIDDPFPPAHPNCRCDPIEDVSTLQSMASIPPAAPDPNQIAAQLPAGFNSGHYASLKGKAAKKKLTAEEIRNLKLYALQNHKSGIPDWINQAEKGGLLESPAAKAKAAAKAKPLPVAGPIKSWTEASDTLASVTDLHELSPEDAQRVKAYLESNPKDVSATTKQMMLATLEEMEKDNQAGYAAVKHLIAQQAQTSVQDGDYPLTPAEYKQLAAFYQATGKADKEQLSLDQAEALEEHQAQAWNLARQRAKAKKTYFTKAELQALKDYAAEHFGSTPAWLLQAEQSTDAAIAGGTLDQDGSPIAPPSWMNSGHYASLKAKGSKALLTAEEIAQAEQYALKQWGTTYPWIEDMKAGKLFVKPAKVKLKPAAQAPAPEPAAEGLSAQQRIKLKHFKAVVKEAQNGAFKLSTLQAEYADLKADMSAAMDKALAGKSSYAEQDYLTQLIEQAGKLETQIKLLQNKTLTQKQEDDIEWLKWVKKQFIEGAKGPDELFTYKTSIAQLFKDHALEGAPVPEYIEQVNQLWDEIQAAAGGLQPEPAPEPRPVLGDFILDLSDPDDTQLGTGKYLDLTPDPAELDTPGIAEQTVQKILEHASKGEPVTFDQFNFVADFFHEQGIDPPGWWQFAVVDNVHLTNPILTDKQKDKLLEDIGQGDLTLLGIQTLKDHYIATGQLDQLAKMEEFLQNFSSADEYYNAQEQQPTAGQMTPEEHAEVDPMEPWISGLIAEYQAKTVYKIELEQAQKGMIEYLNEPPPKSKEARARVTALIGKLEQAMKGIFNAMTQEEYLDLKAKMKASSGDLSEFTIEELQAAQAYVHADPTASDQKKQQWDQLIQNKLYPPAPGEITAFHYAVIAGKVNSDIDQVPLEELELALKHAKKMGYADDAEGLALAIEDKKQSTQQAESAFVLALKDKLSMLAADYSAGKLKPYQVKGIQSWVEYQKTGKTSEADQAAVTSAENTLAFFLTEAEQLEKKHADNLTELAIKIHPKNLYDAAVQELQAHLVANPALLDQLPPEHLQYWLDESITLGDAYFNHQSAKVQTLVTSEKLPPEIEAVLTLHPVGMSNEEYAKATKWLSDHPEFFDKMPAYYQQAYKDTSIPGMTNTAWDAWESWKAGGAAAGAPAPVHAWTPAMFHGDASWDWNHSAPPWVTSTLGDGPTFASAKQLEAMQVYIKGHPEVWQDLPPGAQLAWAEKITPPADWIPPASDANQLTPGQQSTIADYKEKLEIAKAGGTDAMGIQDLLDDLEYKAIKAEKDGKPIYAAELKALKDQAKALEAHVISILEQGLPWPPAAKPAEAPFWPTSPAAPTPAPAAPAPQPAGSQAAQPYTQAEWANLTGMMPGWMTTEGIDKMLAFLKAHPEKLSEMTPDAQKAWGEKLAAAGTPVKLGPKPGAPGQPLDHTLLKNIDMHEVEPTWKKATPYQNVRYGGVIFDDSGKILLRMPKRQGDGSWYDGYAWTFAKGGTDYDGEPAIDVAIREVEEETGHTGQAIGIVPGLHSSGNSASAFFIMKSVKHDPSKMDKETEETRWVTFEEAQKLIKLGTNTKGVQRDLGILKASFDEHAKIQAGQSNYEHIFKGATPAEPPKPRAPRAQKPVTILPAVDLRAQKPDFPTQDRLHTMKVINASPGGSTGAVFVQDPETGKKYVRKQNKRQPDQPAVEAAANHVYQAAGIQTPATQLYTDPKGGGDIILTELVEDTQDLASFMRSATPEQKAKVKKQLQQGYAADALLGNWDVLGADGDNVRIDKNGTAWRVDNGGSFDVRAQGTKKTAQEWHEYPLEIWSMRGMSHPEYGDQAAPTGGAAGWSRQIYGEMKFSQVAESCRQVAARKAEILAATPAEHRDTMRKRLDHIETLGNAGRSMELTRLKDDYQEKFARTLLNHHKIGISDRAPERMQAKREGTPSKTRRVRWSTQPVDENGDPFDDLRTRGGKKKAKNISWTTFVAEQIQKQGGDYEIIADYMGSQASSSWSNASMAVKYWFAQQTHNEGKCYWKTGVDDAKARFEAERKKWDAKLGPGGYEKTLHLYHAAIYDLLSRMDIPGRTNDDGTITTVRTDGKGVLNHMGVKKVGERVGSDRARRGALESCSVFNPENIVSGGHVCVQRVPLSSVFGIYLTERRPGSDSSAFLGDGENEIVCHLADLEFDYVAEDPEHFIE